MRIVKYILLFATLCSLSIANDARILHDVAHFGIGYTINTVSYSAYKLITWDKDRSLLLSFLTTSMLAVGKELLLDRRFSIRDAGWGILGGAASVLTIWTIEVDL